MKRIEFIAPVEAMRGNLSGNQDLKYPTQNNKAFESPEGSVNYARNYSTRFIGAKRASDGLKYFAVKTKTATHITRKSLLAMAVLGGAGAIYAVIVGNKNSELYIKTQEQYIRLQEYGLTDTYRKWLVGHLMTMLRGKELSHTIAGPAGSLTIYNPWIANANDTPLLPGTETHAVWMLPGISVAIRMKFWEQLGPAGAFFKTATTEDGREVKMMLDINKPFEDQKQTGLYIGTLNVGMFRADQGEYVRAIIDEDLNAGNYLYAKSSDDDTPVAVEVTELPSVSDIYSFSKTAPNA